MKWIKCIREKSKGSLSEDPPLIKASNLSPLMGKKKLEPVESADTSSPLSPTFIEHKQVLIHLLQARVKVTTL